jgi:hypothetical protein
MVVRAARRRPAAHKSLAPDELYPRHDAHRQHRLARPMPGTGRVGLEHHPLTAMAALVWSGDLPRPLQQILFDTAERVAAAGPARRDESELQAMCSWVTHQHGTAEAASADAAQTA